MKSIGKPSAAFFGSVGIESAAIEIFSQL